MIYRLTTYAVFKEQIPQSFEPFQIQTLQDTFETAKNHFENRVLGFGGKHLKIKRESGDNAAEVFVQHEK